MPTTQVPESTTIAEARAEALEAGRTVIGQSVVTQAHTRQDTGQAPVALRQSLDPRAGMAGRSAHLLAAVTEAGLLAEGFAPRTIRHPETGAPVTMLPPGQLAVLLCAVEGRSYTETADHLHLSVSTVKGHVGAYYKTLGAHSVPEAVIAATVAGILPLSLFGGTDPEAPEADAPTTRRASARCTGDGCRKRTSHASGACPDHRA